MMRRDKRPFVVEVKRGAKRAVVAPTVLDGFSFDDAIQRAESALFGTGEEKSLPKQSAAGARAAEVFDAPGNAAARRILEAISDEPAMIEAADEPAPKKRGRKPGSKNKPRAIEAPAPKKRRGRPPKVAGSDVRVVPVTADIAGAALDKMARATPAQSAPTGQKTLFPPSASAGEPPVKRGRGRPRKIIPEGGFPPRIPEWITWAQSGDDDTDVGAMPMVETIAEPVDQPRVVQFVRSTERIAARAGLPRAGLRWTRRLRGIAAYARDRRLRKA
jgi:hypothetical protein